MNFEYTEQQLQLRDSVRGLAETHFRPRAFTWEEAGEYPFENLAILAANGLTGMLLDPEQNGQGASLLDVVLAMEQLAQVCPHTADAFHVANFGGIVQIAKFAKPEVQKEILPRLIAGDAIVSIGMSEPEAGSAVNELRTSARYEGDQVVINGQKMWNSEGPHAEWWVVWVRFEDAPEGRDIGSVLVPVDAPGFSQGQVGRFMPGVQYSTLYFDDCRVPTRNVVLEEDGLRRMMNVFNVERLGNATRSFSLGQLALDLAVEHVRHRKQFGRQLKDMQGLQWKIADAHIGLEAARQFTYRAAAEADADGQIPSRDATALAKYQSNVAGFEAANTALQLFGAAGYDDASPISYLFRRTRGWMIAGGTVEILKNQIARGVIGR